MLEKRRNLSNCQVALNGIFNNRRINVSVAPFLLGCLPAASTVLICGPIVRDSVEDYLTTPEKAAVTSYFRHISESFLPTYTTIFIAVGLTNGAVTVSSFVLAMLPMVGALFLTGFLVYLRKVPKDTGMIPENSKGHYWKLLAQSAWSIALAIGIILIFKLPVELAVLICIIINIFVNRFQPSELLPFFRSAFEAKLLVSTWLVMIFKEVLAATGVIEMLPGFFIHITKIMTQNTAASFRRSMTRCSPFLSMNVAEYTGEQALPARGRKDLLSKRGRKITRLQPCGRCPWPTDSFPGRCQEARECHRSR